MVPPAKMTAWASVTMGSKCEDGSRSWNLRVMSPDCLMKKSWPSDVGWVMARRKEVRVWIMGIVDGLGGSLTL